MGEKTAYCRPAYRMPNSCRMLICYGRRRLVVACLFGNRMRKDDGVKTQGENKLGVSCAGARMSLVGACELCRVAVERKILQPEGPDPLVYFISCCTMCLRTLGITAAHASVQLGEPTRVQSYRAPRRPPPAARVRVVRLHHITRASGRGDHV